MVGTTDGYRCISIYAYEKMVGTTDGYRCISIYAYEKNGRDD